MNSEQVFQLAPDEASIKAGKDLAKIKKWQNVGQASQIIFGSCQGSGKNPYLTAVDVQNIVFKCSCPSRKFPCKHAIGLLLLWVEDRKVFSEETIPDWVKEWVEKREKKAEQKEQKEKKPIDVEKQQKRKEERYEKIRSGLNDLQIWLGDLLKGGILKIKNTRFELFTDIAKRMVDAQASALASKLQKLAVAEIETISEQEQFLYELSKLYSICESFHQIESLSDDWKSEIESLVGISQNKEEILSQQPVSDVWLVLYKESTEDGVVQTDIYYLYGLHTKKKAIYLNYIIPNQPNLCPFLVLECFKMDVFYYKGVNSHRVLYANEVYLENYEYEFEEKLLPEIDKEYKEAYLKNIFRDSMSFVIYGVQFAWNRNEIYLIDKEGNAHSIEIDRYEFFSYLVHTGGKPFIAIVSINPFKWELKKILLLKDKENN